MEVINLISDEEDEVEMKQEFIEVTKISQEVPNIVPAVPAESTKAQELPQKGRRNRGRNKKKLLCAHCPYKTYKKTILLRHIHGHTTPFSCSICGMNFFSNAGMKIHTWIHNAVKCLICINDPKELYPKTRRFKNNIKLIEHLVKCHKMSELKAIQFVANGITPDGIPTKSEAKNSKDASELPDGKMENNLQDSPPNIESSPQWSDGDEEDVVDEIFIKNSNRLSLPTNIELLQKCGICEDLFIDREILSRHVKHVHFGLKQPLVPDKNSNPALEKLLNEVSNERFQCIICATSFYKMSSFKAHLKSHTI